MDFDPIAYINEPRWIESRYGLERIQELLRRLDRPQDSLKIIHVAGTNGKGSTCMLLSQILQKAGYRTGLFTSPYIIEFADRIRVNGEFINFDDLKEITLKIKAVADAMDDHPTEFELMTALAFLYFKQQNCDIVVCEAGLGGRLDSTNVIEHPEVSIITSIDLDHTDLLGDSLKAVALEKAGIIKNSIPLVSWPQKEEAKKVVENTAREKNSQLTMPDFSQLHTHSALEYTYSGQGEPLTQTFDYKEYKGLKISLLGSFQPYNASLAIEAVEILRQGGWRIDDAALREGLASARWGGRFEIIQEDPVFIIDGAHNKSAARGLLQSLKTVFPARKFIFLIGFLEDKDYIPILEDFIPYAEAFVTITPPNPRALPAAELAKTLSELQQNYEKEQKVTIGSEIAIENGLAIENRATIEPFEDISLAVARTLELAKARVVGPLGNKGEGEEEHLLVKEGVRDTVDTAFVGESDGSHLEQSEGNTGIICAFGSLYSIHDIREGLGL